MFKLSDTATNNSDYACITRYKKIVLIGCKKIVVIVVRVHENKTRNIDKIVLSMRRHYILKKPLKKIFRTAIFVCLFRMGVTHVTSCRTAAR
jgi:hypothetical protein